jgi:hypothetical protein
MLLMTTFAHLVCDIVDVAAEKEMIGPTARRVVAMVQNLLSMIEGTESKAIRQSMGARFAEDLSKLPVTLRVSSSGPFPTSVIPHLDPRPEPPLHRDTSAKRQNTAGSNTVRFHFGNLTTLA